MLKIISLAFIFLLTGIGTDDKLVPANLEHSAAFGCWVYGDTGGVVKTKVFAQYTDGTNIFIAIYSMRDNASDAEEDCIQWGRAVKEELKNAQKRKEGKVQR